MKKPPRRPGDRDLGRLGRRRPGGAKVVVSARNTEALANAVHEVEARGGGALAVEAEATSEAEAENLCARAVERFGRIDTFVATVMVTVYAEVDQLEADKLRRVLDVNFLGRVHAFRHGRFGGEARTTSAWTAARLRLGKIGGIAVLAAPLAAAAIGYHGVTKRR